MKTNMVKREKSGLLKLIERTENLSKMVHNLLECSNSVAKNEAVEIMAIFYQFQSTKRGVFQQSN